MAVTLDDFMQMSPVFIAVFMLFTSVFNGDVKSFIWLAWIIVGILALTQISKLFKNECNSIKKSAAIDIFSNYPDLSVSTFFIIFTLFYLLFPMNSNKDWNYYVIFGFIGMFAIDTLYKMKYMCTSWVGIIVGSLIGAFYSWGCYSLLHNYGGDKFLYFNTISSNNVYCSKPKKQQFKCNVYKGGEIISTL